MKPFPGEFAYEAQAFGMHYVATVEPHQGEFIALVYIRVPVGHFLYRNDTLKVLAAQDLPDIEVIESGYTRTTETTEDRSGWWFSLGFPTGDFGEIIEAAERICQYFTGEDISISSTPGATVGGPAWEIM